ncbi:MAG: tRNA (5-methylaminomethyl-2-thiouridylate)-methyltransferase, partial [Sulfurifustaceae bacterium]
ARLTARFGKGRTADQVTVSVTEPGQGERLLQVAPLPADAIPESWYL